MSVIQPFRCSGVVRGDDNVLRYEKHAPSLLAMLRTTVEQWPGKEALVEVGGRRLTYRDFWEQSARVAGGLRNAGVGNGDRVAIRLGNGVDWCVSFFGILMAGAIVVPVNIRFSDPEVEYLVTNSGSRYVIAQGEPLPDGEPYVVENLSEKDLAAIFYTSGTTGFAKGAMTTHENFIANAETLGRVSHDPLDASYRTLVSVPLCHVSGCNAQFLVSCMFGGTTVVMPTFDVQQFLISISAERINTLISVPAVYWLAINQRNFRDFDTSQVTRLTYGGAPIAPDLVIRVIEAFPNSRVGNGFGLTETAALSTFLPHEYARLRPETVGFAIPVIEVRLGDREPSGDVGELLIRGQNVVPGYWNQPDATAEALPDGWLRTGDLARIDGEGFVQIVDRKKDMVNRGGENVYCVEVENALTGFHSLFEAAVVGVPDVVMGEKVGAVVVPKPGMTIDVNEMLEFARSQLADFKVPQYVVIQDEMLPRNPGGKILKKELRQTVKWGVPVR